MLSTQPSWWIGGLARRCQQRVKCDTISVAPSIAKKKILCCMILALCVKKKKRIWCKDWFNKKDVYGSNTTILKELQHGHEQDFKNYLRMSISTFFFILLAKVEPYIMKKDTNMRNSITAEARLETTLRYLATGCCQKKKYLKNGVRWLSYWTRLPLFFQHCWVGMP